MGPRKGGEMAGGSGTGEGSVWWIFCWNLKKRDKSFRFFCEGSMSIIEVASLVVFDARGKGKAEGRHEGNEPVEMNGKRREAGAG